MAAQTARVRLLALSPLHRIEACRGTTGFLKDALERNTAVALERMHSRLHSGLARLGGLNPAAVLARGYSIARLQPEGSVVRKASDASVGERLQLELHKGTIDCVVERVYE